ncbi:MAG: RNB domain-containing ribonuclease [Proteobacteria bacterium]|nr:RNB domain-containing ribonuclease [Pseudomonadota bacterium]
MEPGRVVEFIEGQRFLTAVVTRDKTSKLLVLSHTDREMSISIGRIIHDAGPTLNPGKPRHELVRSLQDISRNRDELAVTIDVIELWELLDGEGDEFSYDYLAELIWPAPHPPDQSAAVMRAVFGDGLYFKLRPGIAQRHSAEKVEQITETRERDAERQRELDEGSAWLADVWADRPTEEPACRDRLVRILRDIAINGIEAPEYKWGLKLLENAGLGSDPWRPFYLLVKLGEMSQHENLDILREQVSVKFPDAVRDQAASVSKSSSWMDQPRRDLTGLEVITADSGGARDFDDAVSIETTDRGLRLGVHIADVAAVVRPGSELDREAIERATSIYAPDQRIPMLPEILSEECLSLKADSVRPAFSLLADVTESGEVLSFEFTPSLITVKRQLSYQEVDMTVETDPTLNRLFQLSRALKAVRIEHGALILSMPKLNVFINPEGEIGVNLTLWENPGRSMISEFMILTNHLAGVMLKERQAAGLYRAQNEPSKRIVTGDTDCNDLFPCLLQRRHLNRVVWTTEPAPHSGMGLSVYTNLTSPLRRYIDLIVQRQVCSVARNGKPAYSEEEMSQLLTLIEPALRRANRVQMRRRRYWLLRYFEVQSPKPYEALVIEKLPHRWRIFLTELMLDADLPAQSGLQMEPGQTIAVRVKKVRAREDIFRLELV